MNAPSRGQLLAGAGWFRSPVFDLGLFYIPIWLCWLGAVGLWAAGGLGKPVSLGLWLLVVLAVDAGHVWTTLLHAYGDKGVRRRNADVLWGIPVGLCCIGALLCFYSVYSYWAFVAYVAVYHFIRQNIGIAALYQQRWDRQSGPLDRASKKRVRRLRFWDRACLWLAMGLPLAYWHLRVLEKRIDWFEKRDFVTWLVPLYRWLQHSPGHVGWRITMAIGNAAWLLSLCGWLWLHLQEAKRRGGPFPLAKALWVGTVYVNWALGIVWFDSDTVFSVTNVIAHGIPYYGLMWLKSGHGQAVASGASSSSPNSASAGWSHVRGVLKLVLPAVVCAYTLEYLWDLLVRDSSYSSVFGRLWGYPFRRLFPRDSLASSLLVLALTLPQMTHYFLDGFLWRRGVRNPKLEGQLGLK